MPDFDLSKTSAGADALWARCVPFGIYMGFIVVADGFERLGLGAADLRWLYAVKIAAVVAALLYYRRSYRELAAPRLGGAELLASLVAGLVVFVLWINLDAKWMQVGTSVGFDPQTGGRIDYALVAVRCAGAALVVPVMEELFWRSFLLRWLASTDFLQVDPRHVGWKGFAVVAVLFGVEHSLWFAGIVAGVVYGLLYMHSRNLWLAILAHGVTNATLAAWIIATEHWTYW